MQYIDFHQLHKSIRDQIATANSTYIMDIVKVAQEQQVSYSQERDQMKSGYENIIKALLDESMSIEEGKKRIIMSAEGIEVMEPEPEA